MALATDYDCWHEGHDDVSVEAVLAIIQKNVTTARQIIKESVQEIAAGWQTSDCKCDESLKYAIMTNKDLIPEQTRRDLEPLLGKYIGTTGG